MTQPTDSAATEDYTTPLRDPLLPGEAGLPLLDEDGWPILENASTPDLIRAGGRWPGVLRQLPAGRVGGPLRRAATDDANERARGRRVRTALGAVR